MTANQRYCQILLAAADTTPPIFDLSLLERSLLERHYPLVLGDQPWVLKGKSDSVGQDNSWGCRI
jgi:hypothetical protein